MEESLKRICKEAEDAVNEGKTILILSDKSISSEFAPIPSLMATGSVHHYLVEKRIRTKAG
jgi:glutamate synthase (NADPH/NADH) large chain